MDGAAIMQTLGDEQRAIFDYWQAKCRDGRLPAREDISPADLRLQLPMIGLIDVSRTPARLRYRYRLIGTYMVEMFGEDFTGTYVDESKHGTYGAYLHELYSDASENRHPVFAATTFEYRGRKGDRDRSYLVIERLLLPLARDDDDVNMILFSNKFRSRYRSALQRPYRQRDLLGHREDKRHHWHKVSVGA